MNDLPTPDPRTVEAYDRLGMHAEVYQRVLESYGSLRGRHQILEIWCQLHSSDAPSPSDPALLEQFFIERQGDLFTLEKECLALTAKVKSLEERVAKLSAESTVPNGSPAPPAADSTGRPAPLSPFELVQLRAVLIRLRLLQPTEPLADPDKISTGDDGISRVLQFKFAKSGRRIIAKFDAPDRAAREWNAISTLRGLNIPAETLLPHPHNLEHDEVIIYPVAGNHLLTEFASLAEFSCGVLDMAPRNAIRALNLALEPLSYFYGIDPGLVSDRNASGVAHWGPHFHKIDASIVTATASSAFPGADWGATTVRLGDAEFVNPILIIDHYINALTGPIRLSRVHGDLHFKNILVCYDSARTAKKAYIIDLSHTKEHCPTAIDFSFMEFSFWKHIFYPSLEGANCPEDICLQLHASILNDLDGRSPAGGQANLAPYKDIADGARLFVAHLRNWALRFLKPHPNLPYLLNDYYVCLLLTFLSQLHWEKSKPSSWRGRMLLLTAAAAATTLRDIDRARYSTEASAPLVPPPLRIQQICGGG